MIEGMCTVVLAVALWFVLPNRVDDCKWLSAEEKTAIWERKSTGTAADPLCRKFEWHYLTECLRDYKVLIPTWLAMVSIFQRCVARLTSGFEHRRLRVRRSSIYRIQTRTDTYRFAFQFPTILTQMGYKAQNAQLLTVPV